LPSTTRRSTGITVPCVSVAGGLPRIRLSDMMSDMRTVTLRDFRRNAALLDAAARGEDIVVTRFGKPYVRISAADRPRTFVGAGIHLRQKAAVSPEPTPRTEWNGLD
jgi:antitoxin (DNA-binding transcriptional repressor) of toxin-antitoxin stability system